MGLWPSWGQEEVETQGGQEEQREHREMRGMTKRAKFTESGKRKAQGQLWSWAKNTFKVRV